MSTTTLSNLSRRRQKLADVEKRAEKSRQKWIQEQKEVQEGIENVVALLIDTRSASLTEVAREMGCSRDKIQGMAKRARKRNREILEAKTKANKRLRCDSCIKFLPGEYGLQGRTTCYWCERGQID